MTALQDVDQLIGRQFGGKYQIASRIGEGAVAMIYRARQTDPSRAVALKVVRPEIGRNPTVSARFQREVKAASKLTHRGIVRVLDWGLERDMPWLAMELIEGEDLFDVLDRSGHLPQGWSVAVGVQVCEALAAAHAEGVIHRDLKPENIMLTTPHPRTGEQYVKILDFGIAKLLGPSVDDVFSDETVPQVLTKAGSAVGTPSHMAPEQAQGKAVDGRADLYAVGVLLYEMVTGHLPFEGTNPMLVAIQQVKDAPPSPRDYLPNIHPHLEALIMRTLEKDPARRPQTAAELAEGLRIVHRGLEEEDGPTVRHPAPQSEVAAISSIEPSEPTITRITALRWHPEGRDDDDDDDDDDETATHVALELGGPATRVVQDDGPATRMVHDDGPATRMVEDDGPATRMVYDAGPATRLASASPSPEDDGPTTRLVGELPSADDDDEPATRMAQVPATRIVPAQRSPLGTDVPTREVAGPAAKLLGIDEESEDVTIRQQDLFEIQDELTSLNRRPAEEDDAARPRRMSPNLSSEPEAPEVATRVVDNEEPVTNQRPALDSEAPVATVVADVEPLLGGRGAAHGAQRSALKAAPVPRLNHTVPSSGYDDPGGGFQRRRATRKGHPHVQIEDPDSEDEPVATVITDPESLVLAARRAAQAAGLGARPGVRPLVGDAVMEAPPPPPPSDGASARPNRRRVATTEPGGGIPLKTAPMAAFEHLPASSAASVGPGQASGQATSQLPSGDFGSDAGLPRPVAQTTDLPDMSAIARSISSTLESPAHPPVEPGATPGIDAPTDWGGGPVSRDYAGELEDMLRQMPKRRGRPVFSTLLVIVVITLALTALAFVVFY